MPNTKLSPEIFPPLDIAIAAREIAEIFRGEMREMEVKIRKVSDDRMDYSVDISVPWTHVVDRGAMNVNQRVVEMLKAYDAARTAHIRMMTERLSELHSPVAPLLKP